MHFPESSKINIYDICMSLFCCYTILLSFEIYPVNKPQIDVDSSNIYVE